MKLTIQMQHATIEQLNDIQQKWMELTSEQPEGEKNAVFELMKLLPSEYLSVSLDGKMANAMNAAGPMWSEARPISDALAYARIAGWRTDVAWCGKLGRWVDLRATTSPG